jgi:hypothetical protein|tara:strand:+ start:3329 stop:3712 length:384 start_codon:yes stop_codon:yes gene_type:complete
MPGQEYNGFDPRKPEDPEDLYWDVMSIKNTAQKRISVEVGYPRMAAMEDGAISFRYIPGQGMFLYVKFREKLYNTRMAEDGRTGLAKLIDNTSGTVNGDTLDTTVSNTTTDDLATLTAKINEIIGKL